MRRILASRLLSAIDMSRAYRSRSTCAVENGTSLFSSVLLGTSLADLDLGEGPPFALSPAIILAPLKQNLSKQGQVSQKILR